MEVGDPAKCKLSVGPLLFNWTDAQMEKFYAEVAQDAHIDRVYLGEVVCAKRFSKRRSLFEKIIQQLQLSGKEVFLSTPCLVVDPRDLELLDYILGFRELLPIEANDLTAAGELAGNPFAVGPYINLYGEQTLDFFIQEGARHLMLPFEMGREAIMRLQPAAGIEVGYHVFGLLPLAIASRCYHARAYGKRKDTCGIVCGNDPDGLEVTTLDGKAFLTINGLQTLSAATANLIQEIQLLQKAGVSNFRISPQLSKMSTVSAIFRSVLDRHMTGEDAARELQKAFPDLLFANGYFHQVAGHAFSQAGL